MKDLIIIDMYVIFCEAKCLINFVYTLRTDIRFINSYFIGVGGADDF